MPEIVTMVDTLGQRPVALAAVSRFEGEGFDAPALEPWSAVEAARRGLSGRCPKCGCTRLFRSFLQPGVGLPRLRPGLADPYGGRLSALSRHPAHRAYRCAIDDRGGKRLASAARGASYAVAAPLALLLGLLLIQPMKGAVIAVQWWHWDRVEPAPPDMEARPADGGAPRR
jgi:hypothetical protein